MVTHGPRLPCRLGHSVDLVEHFCKLPSFDGAFRNSLGAEHVELKNCRPGLITKSSASALCGALMLSFKKRPDLCRLDIRSFATLVQNPRVF
jgi:hypothetical protein